MDANADRFQIRSANSAGNDVDFIVAAWDSTLPYLASIGAGEMWGDQPFSQREGFRDDITEIIKKSEKDDQNDSKRLLVAHLRYSDHNADEYSRVGVAMIRDALPYYIVERPELVSESNKTESLLFIEVLFSDHRSQPRHRGAGVALIEAIKGRALARGRYVVYVDAWAGNVRRLNK
jgi:hypothetical protein